MFSAVVPGLIPPPAERIRLRPPVFSMHERAKPITWEDVPWAITLNGGMLPISALFPDSLSCTSAISVSWLKFHTSKGKAPMRLVRYGQGVSL